MKTLNLKFNILNFGNKYDKITKILQSNVKLIKDNLKESAHNMNKNTQNHFFPYKVT